MCVTAALESLPWRATQRARRRRDGNLSARAHCIDAIDVRRKCRWIKGFSYIRLWYRARTMHRDGIAIARFPMCREVNMLASAARKIFCTACIARCVDGPLGAQNRANRGPSDSARGKFCRPPARPVGGLVRASRAHSVDDGPHASTCARTAQHRCSASESDALLDEFVDRLRVGLANQIRGRSLPSRRPRCRESQDVGDRFALTPHPLGLFSI